MSMFGRMLSIAVCIGLFASPALTQEIPKAPLSVRGMTPWAQRVYLDGVVDGFQIVNAKLQRQEREPLYCIPEKVVLYGRDLLEFASKDLVGAQDDMTIAVSGLLGLIERYPCPISQKDEAILDPTPTHFPENASKP